MVTLKENECLVRVGHIELRAPDGTPLPSLPQYIIVSVERADPAAIATVKENERIVLVGHYLRNKKNAEERFAAMKAGREIPPKEEVIYLYIITDIENIDPQSGLLIESAKACAAAGKELAELIAIHKRKEQALEKQGLSVAIS